MKKWYDEATGLWISSSQSLIPYYTLKQFVAFEDTPTEFRLSTDWFRPFSSAVTETIETRCSHFYCHVTSCCLSSSSFCRACRSSSSSAQRFLLDSAPSTRGLIFGLNVDKHWKKDKGNAVLLSYSKHAKPENLSKLTFFPSKIFFVKKHTRTTLQFYVNMSSWRHAS